VSAQLKERPCHEYDALNPQGWNHVDISPLQEFTDLAQLEPEVPKGENLLQLHQIR